MMADYCDLFFNWECDKDPTYVTDYFLESHQDSEGSEAVSFPTKLQIYKGSEEKCDKTSCELTVQCKSVYRVGITGIRFISESRNVEVFGQREGYIQTVRGKSVPSSEDNVNHYMSDFDTEEPASTLTFKFLSLKGKVSFEMCRIQITLTQVEPPEHKSDMDLEKLRTHVKELGDKVSDKAKSLLETMEQYQKNQHGALDNVRSMISASSLPPEKSSSMSGMAGLLSMFSQMRPPRNNEHTAHSETVSVPKEHDDPRDLAGNLLTQISTHNGDTMKSEDMYNFLHSVCGRVSKLRKDKPVVEENTQDSTSATTPSPVDTQVMEEVNQRIQAAEERITNHLEKRLSEMETRLNKKMDMILQLLTPEEEEKEWVEESNDQPNPEDKTPEPIELD